MTKENTISMSELDFLSFILGNPNKHTDKIEYITSPQGVLWAARMEFDGWEITADGFNAIEHANRMTVRR